MNMKNKTAPEGTIKSILSERGMTYSERQREQISHLRRGIKIKRTRFWFLSPDRGGRKFDFRSETLSLFFGLWLGAGAAFLPLSNETSFALSASCQAANPPANKLIKSKKIYKLRCHGSLRLLCLGEVWTLGVTTSSGFISQRRNVSLFFLPIITFDLCASVQDVFTLDRRLFLSLL